MKISFISEIEGHPISIKGGFLLLSDTDLRLIQAVLTVIISDQSSPTPQSVNLAVTMPTTAPLLQTVSEAVVNTTNGLTNGSETVTTTAGLGPYTYSYAPGASFTNILNNTHSQSGLARGSYTATVQKNNGLSVSKNFSLFKSTRKITTMIK